MNDKVMDTNQFLTFNLGEEVFALDIATVREVLEITDVTRIPRTPEFMRGVINLRGHAVPVVDMRRKFSMEPTEDTINTCIIIVEVFIEDEQTILGALVDSVREVYEMQPDQIEPAPRMGSTIKAEFIYGMGQQDGEFVIILDISRVFSAEELSLIQESAPADEAV